MKRSLYIAFVWLCISMTGCTDGEVFVEVQEDIRVVASLDEGSRIAYQEGTDGSGQRVLRTLWEVGDRIGLYTDEQGNLPYEATLADEKGEFAAVSTALSGTEGKTVYAYYPYSGESTGVDEIVVPGNYVQTYQRNKGLEFYYAEGKVSRNELNLKFKPVFATLRLVIPASYAPADGSKWDLRVVADDGDAVLSWPNGASFNGNSKEVSGEGTNWLVYNMPEVTPSTETLVCHIAIVPGLEGTSIKIYSVQGVHSSVLLTKDAPDGGFKAGNVYSVSLADDEATVKTLQAATIGKGIDIVLMGDGYSERLIKDGTYEEVMRKAMEYFFAEEPYRSHRDYFNVRMVEVVSKDEVITGKLTQSGVEYSSDTALKTYFGTSTFVGGDGDSCVRYARKALGAGVKMRDVTIIVMMNSTKYAGTCYMSYPMNASDYKYGAGRSISYFPVGADDEAFRKILNHEANGHGFGKLADEYYYVQNGTFPKDRMEEVTMLQGYGWNQNVDYDITTIDWNRFMDDPYYAIENLGAYEGAATYLKGVWRPTNTSTMVYNEGGFNAPSRFAIYNRIHYLAGTGMAGNYEEFKKQDTPIPFAAPRASMDMEGFVPLAPPVMVVIPRH